MKNWKKKILCVFQLVLIIWYIWKELKKLNLLIAKIHVVLCGNSLKISPHVFIILRKFIYKFVQQKLSNPLSAEYLLNQNDNPSQNATFNQQIIRNFSHSCPSSSFISLFSSVVLCFSDVFSCQKKIIIIIVVISPWPK